jgi:acyl-CoA dehydrogenase
MDHERILSLPFFDAHHRSMSTEFSRWVDDELAGYTNLEDKVGEKTKDLVRKMGRAGWLRYCVPAAFGGAFDKLDSRSICIQREILTHAFALSDASLSMQGIGSAGISLFGRPDTQAAYLPKVLSGEYVGALALTESQSGSDVANTQATARREGSDYIIEGTKAWISNAGIADYYITIVRTGEAPGAKGLSAFVVDADNPGLKVEEITDIMAPHPVGSLRFTNCRVSADRMLGQPGDGFKLAMATLDIFRPTAAAAALGLARRALDEALTWIQERKMFGQALAKFQNTQMRVADMAVDIDATALLVYRAAWIKDCGADRPTRSASMAKLFASEAAGRVADTALQLFGATGVKHGMTIERLYREARVMRIYEGASEIQRLIIGGNVIEQSNKQDGACHKPGHDKP